MMTDGAKPGRAGAVTSRFRWGWLAPVLAFVALAAWAFASPIGAGPDDDYHLTSTWCAVSGSAQCEAGSSPTAREVSEPLVDVACYAYAPEKSAACQYRVMDEWNHATVETGRGNFAAEYPPVYYAAMHVFAGADLQVSALAMRLINAALFVLLGTALALLLPLERRPTLLWGWLVTLVPLGVFLIPSNNPSGWAIAGVGTTFLALTGWYETVGSRRWALGALALVGALMAGGARGDAAVYAIGAVVTATIIAAPWRGVSWRGWWHWAWLPAIGILVSAVFFATSGQSGVAESGFSGGAASIPGTHGDGALSGFALAAYNLLMLPFLWTGVFGTWALGWLDTSLPAIVPWASTAAFIVVAFAGVGRINWRKAIAATGVLLVLVILPVWVLTRGGNSIGENLQPRYLLPLIVLFAFVLLIMPAGGRLRFTRVQTFLVLAALALANLVALQVNIRRYVTGIDRQGLNLDAGAQWWWNGFPVGPTALWVIGALAFAGALAALWPELRRTAEARPETSVRARRELGE